MLMDVLAWLADERLLLPTVSIYNYGEPFLHPDIEGMLHVLSTYGVKADISSNFSIVPELNESSLRILNSVALSLSGITQLTYGKIHGFDINKTINNFQTLVRRIQDSNAGTKLFVYWHRYRFNAVEEQHARTLFESMGVRFMPVDAFVAEVPGFIHMLRHASVSEMRDVSADLYWDRIETQCRRLACELTDYRCRQHEILTIDYNGHLVPCCGLPRSHGDFDRGFVVGCSREDLYDLKSGLSICNDCLSTGIAQYLHEPH